MSQRIVGLFVILMLVSGTAILRRSAATAQEARPLPTVPTTPFAPSNARTADGQLIPVEQFFPAARCLTCHQDTHAAWAQSLHRNAAREPFYRESADILLKTRGIEFTRHCESCHTPVALFSGALVSTATGRERVAPFTSLDDEGVTCSVCHSVTEARLDGTGSFTIRRPALLAKEGGTPVFGDFTDEQILADVPGHKRAVMSPTLRSPEFCATCHKVDAPPSLNGYKHIRGFSAYDEWQQSGASHESVLPFYRREQRTDCRACHMPKVESHNDRAAKEGKIASHRWLGANTAAPSGGGGYDAIYTGVSVRYGTPTPPSNVPTLATNAVSVRYGTPTPPTQIPSYVANGVSVRYGTPSPPTVVPSQVYAPVSVTLGPVITGVSPASLAKGASVTVTLSGSNLSGANLIRFANEDGTLESNISASNLNVNGNGTSLTATVSVNANTTTGNRIVLVTTTAGVSLRVNTGTNMLQIVP